MNSRVQKVQDHMWMVDCGRMVGSARELAEYLMREYGMTVLVSARDLNRVEPRSLVVLIERSLSGSERDAVALAVGEYERMVVDRC